MRSCRQWDSSTITSKAAGAALQWRRSVKPSSDLPESQLAIMLLNEIVETSNRTAAVSGRLAKIGLLAETLRHAEREEVDIAVAYLAGELREGRIGIGYAAL